jgi:hypothetical protein
MNLTLSSGTLFGLGERNGDFFVKDGVYTIWNKDNKGILENG